MKKSVLALAMAFGVTSAFAQDLTSKKGEPILPEAGDWAISADATPVLGYLKGFIGNNQGVNQTPSFNFLTGNSVIVGKYFKDEKTAYRAGINIGFNTQSWSKPIADQTSTATPQANVTDKKTQSTTGIGLTAGIEKRKGKTRLQGYYGAELGIYFGGVHDKYTYGNSYTATYNTPASTNFGASAADNSISSNVSGNSRYTDIKSGTTVQFGVRGFIGVEYFVLPKISLGGEFGWGIGVTAGGKTSNTLESLNTTANGSTTVTTTGGKNSTFNIGTDNKNSIFGPTGSLRMNFYF